MGFYLLQVDGLPNAFVRISAANGDDPLYLDILHVDDTVKFDLVVKDAKPLLGTIYVLFTSQSGTASRLQVRINLSVLRPVIELNPPLIRANIVRGTQKILNINLTNIGEVEAKNIKVSLPNDKRLTLVSFTTSSSDGSDEILPGQSGLISIAVTTSSTEGLGEMTGTIYINSDLSSKALQYVIYIVSLQMFNVTFTVKDEYTYFAEGAPLVSNAKVRLVNPRRGYSEIKYTTNETGL